MTKVKDRKIVVVNQAVNYLTIGICNAFSDRFENVSLITGGIHPQGEELKKTIKITKIKKYRPSSSNKKLFLYSLACLQIWWLLLIKFRKHEVFFVSLPPMGYLLNLLLPHKFSMLIWDVYPDTFKITGMKESHFVYKAWAYLNKKSFSKSFKLFTIGHKMADLLSIYVEKQKIIVQPIWSIFQNNSNKGKINNPFVADNKLEDKFIVQYSGNIGLTHKVEVLLEIAKKIKFNNKIVFQIIGKGPRLNTLKVIAKENNLKNCQFLPFQDDGMFPFSLSAADLGVVILDEKTSKGSVPSKSYNLMSYGIPAIYISSKDSELNEYAIKYQHAKCFNEDEIEEAANWIIKISTDSEKHAKMSVNAEKASHNFKRNNANKLIGKYLM